MSERGIGVSVPLLRCSGEQLSPLPRGPGGQSLPLSLQGTCGGWGTLLGLKALPAGFSCFSEYLLNQGFCRLSTQPASPRWAARQAGDRLLSRKGSAAVTVSPGALGDTPPPTSWCSLQTPHLAPGLAFVLICVVLTEVIWQH